MNNDLKYAKIIILMLISLSIFGFVFDKYSDHKKAVNFNAVKSSLTQCLEKPLTGTTWSAPEMNDFIYEEASYLIELGSKEDQSGQGDIQLSTNQDLTILTAKFRGKTYTCPAGRNNQELDSNLIQLAKSLGGNNTIILKD